MQFSFELCIDGRESLEEREMLWKHKPPGSVFTVFAFLPFSDSVEKRYNTSFILYFLDASHLRVPMKRLD